MNRFIRGLAGGGFSDPSQIPGATSTKITLRSPTQSDAIAAGIAADKPPVQLSAVERIKLGDKDMRSYLAEQKLRIANDLVGGGYSRDELVDMLNQPGVQNGDQFANAFSADSYVQDAFSAGEANQLARPEFETRDFVGEGQFGRVSELAPGYVIKEQAPLVDFSGYKQTDGSGNMRSARGELVPDPEVGNSIQDYRNVAEEVDQLNYLNKSGITPKVENFIINDDGSTEVIMKDLRNNFDVGKEYLADADERKSRMAYMRSEQQQAQAALKGIALKDRHMGNVMFNKMTGRPLQIDPSGVNVSGIERDVEIARAARDGMQAAGLSDEAEIFDGLLNDLWDKGDAEGFHNMAQQGVSRLMKLKNVADSNSGYQKLL